MKVTVKLPRSLEKKLRGAGERAVSALVAYARDRMTHLAQQHLRRTAQTYTNGIGTPVVNGGRAVIALNGALPTMLERSSGPYDLKKMLKGRRYVDIPFRHGTPDSTSLPAMPKPVYNTMRAMAQGAKGRVRGPSPMPGGALPQTKKTEFGTYRHRVGKHASMLRVPPKYGAATQAQYVTFRRMSQNSAASSWIHPGFKPVGIFPTVAKEVRKLAQKLIADYVRQGLL